LNWRRKTSPADRDNDVGAQHAAPLHTLRDDHAVFHSTTNCGLLFFPSFLLARDAKFIAEGKNEGKVVIYGSTDEPDAITMAEKRKEYRKIFQ